MGKSTKLWGLLSRLLFALVFVASIGVFFITKTGSGWVDFIINMMFSGLVLLFLVIFFEGCIGPMGRVTSALRHVTDDIRTDAGSQGELWQNYGTDLAPFGNRRLDDRYAAFLREYRRLQKQNPLTADCRIEDYINEEIIYAAVNKPFCDQLSGIMSGLGILFTFIGLVYGLRNFDASTVDVMQSSTQALMAGIKIAFLTSIFGLIYSLIVGLTYKKMLKDAVETLYAFQETYTERVRPVNEHGAENAMLVLQKQQADTLSGFGTNIGTQVSEAITAMAAPAIAQLQKTLQDYVTVSIEDQRSGMDKIVRYFMDSMNSSMGDMFLQLKQRTAELAEMEKDMMRSISVMTENMGHAGKDIIDAQTAARSITEKMQAYTANIQSLTESQQQVIDRMQSFMADYQESQRKEAEYLSSLAESSAMQADNAGRNLATAQSIADIAEAIRSGNRANADEIAQAGARMKQAAASVDALSLTFASDINRAAERLEQSADRIDQTMSRSVTESLSAIDHSLAKLAGGMDSMIAATDTVTKAMGTLPKTVSGVDSDLKATTRALEGELKLLLKAFSETQKIVTRYNNDLERRTGV